MKAIEQKAKGNGPIAMRLTIVLKSLPLTRFDLAIARSK